MTSDLTAPPFELLTLADVDLADMPALTIKPPWAYAIFHLGKTVENRTWRPLGRWRHYRGPLLLHAGVGLDRAARDPRTGERFPEVAYQVRGALVGVVVLTGAHPPGILAPSGDPDTGCSPVQGGLCTPWGQDDAFHWVLASPVKFRRPVYCAGALGLWTPERLPAVPRAHLRAELDSLPPIATAPATAVERRTPRDASRDIGNAPASATGPTTTPTGDPA